MEHSSGHLIWNKPLFICNRGTSKQNTMTILQVSKIIWSCLIQITQSTRTHSKGINSRLSPSQIFALHTKFAYTHSTHPKRHLPTPTQHNRHNANLAMRFTLLTALLLPILVSALALPALPTDLDNAKAPALNVRQDGILGDETSDSSVCGPGIDEEQCDACFGENPTSDCGW